MISGKGILYTVLGAASAAVVVGTMLTGGARREKLRSIGSGVQRFLGQWMKERPSSPQSRMPDTGMGHV